MNTRADRIRLALKESGHTPTTASGLIGCTAAAIQQWLSGDTKNIKNDNLFKLADLTGYEARWLATGEGPSKPLGGEREKRLMSIYAQLDERGKDSVLRVAEAESAYVTPNQEKRRNAA